MDEPERSARRDRSVIAAVIVAIAWRPRGICGPQLRRLAAMSEGSSPERQNPAPGPRSLLTAADLAARWQVPESHVYRLTRSGVLPVVRLGRYYRYRVDVIEEWELAGGMGTQ
jgi:excisionase family DNA binding protein